MDWSEGEKLKQSKIAVSSPSRKEAARCEQAKRENDKRLSVRERRAVAEDAKRDN